MPPEKTVFASLIPARPSRLATIATQTAAAFCLIFFSCAVAADQSEVEVRKAFDRFQDSWLKYDVASAERIVSNDFLWISQGGRILGKNDWLRTLKDQRIENRFTREDMKIRLYGDTAVVNYTDTATSSAGATTKTIRTILLVKTSGLEWKVVLHHATPGRP